MTSYFGVTNQNMDKITSFFTETTLKKGAYFLKTGQYCEKLSFVKSGFLRFYAINNEREVTQWISAKGYFVIDLYSFNFKQRARWNIQALTDCELYTISKEDYELLNNTIPDWAEKEKLFLTSCFTQLEERVFSHLSLSAEERYYRFLKIIKNFLIRFRCNI